MTEGWIGGGCARAAVAKAAKEALADGKPRLVSVQPPDVLQEQGLSAGEERAGVRFARNMCPSRGTMDVFVEPVLPRPRVVIFGGSPVAVAIADLGRRMGFSVTVCAPAAEQGAFAEADERIEGYALPVQSEKGRYRRGLDPGPGRRGGAGSRTGGGRRLCRLRGQPQEGGGAAQGLAGRGVDPERLAAFKAPAGLDLGAITPEEIAVSILAEIVAFRRQASRGAMRRLDRLKARRRRTRPCRCRTRRAGCAFKDYKAKTYSGRRLASA